jgi:hypothetical protein
VTASSIRSAPSITDTIRRARTEARAGDAGAVGGETVEQNDRRFLARGNPARTRGMDRAGSAPLGIHVGPARPRRLGCLLASVGGSHSCVSLRSIWLISALRAPEPGAVHARLPALAI